MPEKSIDPRIELGRRLAAHRNARKLTVDGLAAVANLDVSNIRKIEAGSNPRLVTLLKIAGVLEVDLAELFRDIDPYALEGGDRPTKVSEVDERFWRPRDRIA
ncbi:helix-turn-helix transcriptional regulator [Microbacterium sp. KR10-403]|uniref:helix-turn-helix domain-containing protein n=1 Tax=Microbacterium sp. KR10-403 TaxID=3158581 RepID=UPI0032E51DE7